MFVIFHACVICVFRFWHVSALISIIVIIHHCFKDVVFVKFGLPNDIKHSTEANIIICLIHGVWSSKLRNHVQVASVIFVFLIIVDPESYVVWWTDHFVVHSFVGQWWFIISLRRDITFILVPLYIFEFLISWVWRFETVLCVCKFMQNCSTRLIKRCSHPAMRSCLNRNRKWLIVHFL